MQITCSFDRVVEMIAKIEEEAGVSLPLNGDEEISKVWHDLSSSFHSFLLDDKRSAYHHHFFLFDGYRYAQLLAISLF